MSNEAPLPIRIAPYAFALALLTEFAGLSGPVPTADEQVSLDALTVLLAGSIALNLAYAIKPSSEIVGSPVTV